MKRWTKFAVVIIAIGVVILSVYSISGNRLSNIFNVGGSSAASGFDISGEQVFPDYPVLPIPSGDLNASQVVTLPNIYGDGHGWTCTGLAYDEETDTFFVGDIGLQQPGEGTIQSQLVRVNHGFTSVISTVPIQTIYPSMSDVQGITIDTSDRTIWFVCPSKNTLYHISLSGSDLGTVTVTSPTGIAYSPVDDSFWVLNYSNKIMRVSKTGTVLESYDFAYQDQLDQCFLDVGHGLLYITAGANYSSRNNVYCFNTQTHQQGIACTVDSYSVEGIWIGETEMIIVNDGYYHSAYDNRNVACIYDLS